MTTIRITVNGEQRTLRNGDSVADLLDHLGLDRSVPGTAVAVNWSLVRKPEWATAPLEDGDEVEIVSATQGG